MKPGPCRVRRLGLRPYAPIVRAMRDFTDQRNGQCLDEIWLLQHLPVYTQGLNCTALPRPAGDAVPVVKTDRGGQITYHGPGQLVVYVLLDLRRYRWGPKWLVRKLEQAVIDYLAGFQIASQRHPGRPGVYVGTEKIAALGLRIRHGCTYHGLSLNVDLDMTPFQAIDPCGYPGLAVTSMRDQGVVKTPEQAGDDFLPFLAYSLELDITPTEKPV